MRQVSLALMVRADTCKQAVAGSNPAERCQNLFLMPIKITINSISLQVHVEGGNSPNVECYFIKITYWFAVQYPQEKSY